MSSTEHPDYIGACVACKTRLYKWSSLWKVPALAGAVLLCARCQQRFPGAQRATAADSLIRAEDMAGWKRK